MARPASKQQLISAATDNYDKLTAFITSMSAEELNTPFDFSADEKKKEAHWRRDKNLRDVVMHLVRWQGTAADIGGEQHERHARTVPPPRLHMEDVRRHEHPVLGRMSGHSHRRCHEPAQRQPQEGLGTRGKFYRR